MSDETHAHVAVVAGVGPGLGRSLCLRFAREGYAVAALSRRAESVRPVTEAASELSGDVHGFACDMTDPGQVADVYKQIRDALGDPHVAIYNAGAFQLAGVAELDPETFEQCWRVNCFGGFLLAQQALATMQPAGRGTILLTGATAALRGGARFSALAVGKFGLRALAQSLAREFGPQGIHVGHVIVDGQIDEPKMRDAFPDRDPGSFLNPDAIAESYWQLHCQDPTAWTLELDLRPNVERF